MIPMIAVYPGHALFAAALLAAAAPALAQPPSVAPVPSAQGAEFALEGAADASQRTATARGDGAQLVACGATLVTATDGSRVAIACGDGARLDLDRGAFRIAVGSKGATIRMGGASFRAVSASIRAGRVGDRWVISFSRDGDVGSVEITGDEAAAAPAEGAAPAPVALAPTEVRVFEGSAPAAAAADPATLTAFHAAIDRLKPRAAASPALTPRRVESADDFKQGATTVAMGAGEVEVEAIEVEAGCIEVCVD
jgi:hypothetical protein